jgi:hypothetical protein
MEANSFRELVAGKVFRFAALKYAQRKAAPWIQ